MSLRMIAVQNYRCFQAWQELEISPVTVILGKNNAGKSAILRAPLVFQTGLDSASSAALDLGALRTDIVQEYADLVYGRIAHRELSVCFTTARPGRVTLEASIVLDDVTKFPVVNTWQFETPENSLTLQWRPTTRTYSVNSGPDRELEFCGLRPLLHEPWRTIIDTYWPRIGPVNYIGPFRERPVRVHHMPHQVAPDVGARGEHAEAYLIHDTARHDGALLRKVNEYLLRLLPNVELQVKPLAGTGLWQTVVIGPSGAEINLVDVGSGVAQVLPILVQCAALELGHPTPAAAIQLLEEPELHLHPGAHAAMADLLLHVARESGTSFIIETHSETFLLRLRRRLAERHATPADIGLHVVEQANGSATLQRINVDENGVLDYWPDGYFDQDFEEVKALTREQLKRGVGNAA